VVAKSSGCERLFSQMGIVHSKYRSRLQLPEWVRDTIVLKTALICEFDVGKPAKHRQLKHQVQGFNSEHNSNRVSIAVMECKIKPVVEDTGFSMALGHEQGYHDAHDLDVEASGDFEGFFALLTHHLIEDVRVDAEAAAELEGTRDENSIGTSQSNSFGQPLLTTLSTTFDFSAALSSPAELHLSLAPEAKPIHP
ncbi:hypothetical protein FRC10_003038, partial [Ceratobasidium sp. 414]